MCIYIYVCVCHIFPDALSSEEYFNFARAHRSSKFTKNMSQCETYFIKIYSPITSNITKILHDSREILNALEILTYHEQCCMC